MRTDRVSVLKLGIPVVVALALGLGRNANGATPVSWTELSALGIEVTASATLPYVSKDQAIEVAARDALGMIPSDAKVDAVVGLVTDNGTLKAGDQVNRRLIWLLRYSGFSITLSGPPTRDGTPSDGGTVSRAYVYIDATTGTWLLTRLEGP
jgi:hypothetical protein